MIDFRKKNTTLKQRLQEEILVCEQEILAQTRLVEQHTAALHLAMTQRSRALRMIAADSVVEGEPKDGP
jgi:hypothetical protein